MESFRIQIYTPKCIPVLIQSKEWEVEHGRRPAWMNVELLSELRHKEGPQRWTQQQAAERNTKNFHAHQSRVCKAKAQPEVKPAKEVKGKKKGVYND